MFTTSSNYGERIALLSNIIDDLSGTTSNLKKRKRTYLRVMIHDIKNTDKRSLHLENNNIISTIDSISE